MKSSCWFSPNTSVVNYPLSTIKKNEKKNRLVKSFFRIFVVLIGILIAFQLNKCSDNQAKKVTQINQSNRKLYDNHFYPYIKTNFDLVNWDKIDFSPKEDKKLYHSKEFANTVSTYRFLLAAKQRIYQNQMYVIEDYLDK